MLCARCKKAPATFAVKVIDDNQVSETHLCLSCANSEAASGMPPAVAGLLSLLGAVSPAKEKAAPARCPTRPPAPPSRIPFRSPPPPTRTSGR